MSPKSTSEYQTLILMGLVKHPLGKAEVVGFVTEVYKILEHFSFEKAYLCALPELEI